MIHPGLGDRVWYIAFLPILLLTVASAISHPQVSILSPDSISGLPLVDLAVDSARQSVVDREEGQYLGHPTTTLLDDSSTILAVYPMGHGAGPIVMKKSTDGGRTWSSRLPTPRSWESSKETPTIHRISCGGGRTRLLLFSGLYPIRMSISEDRGEGWSELEPIGDFGGIVTMSSLEQLSDGKLLALFHDDGRFFTPGSQHAVHPVFTVFRTISSDCGLTWSFPRGIACDSAVHLCEPGLVRSPHGDTFAVLLRENSRSRNSFVIFSSDRGETWSNPRELPASLTGDRHVGCYTPDGRIVVVFRDMARGSPTHGDWVGWVGRFEDLAASRPGLFRIRFMKNWHDADCGYSGLELLPDGTFVATSYGHWISGKEPYIVAVRFRMEELDWRLQKIGK